MNTPIETKSRLIALFIILKLEKLNIGFTETDDSIIADIDPAKAWEMGIIEAGNGFGNYKPVLN